MAHVTPVTPNIPLLGSGVVSLVIAILLGVFALDFAHPDMTFAFFAIVMVVTGVYGLMGTILGLSTLIPGIDR